MLDAYFILFSFLCIIKSPHVLLSLTDLPIGVLRVIGFVFLARQYHHRVIHPIDDGPVGGTDGKEKFQRFGIFNISS